MMLPTASAFVRNLELIFSSDVFGCLICYAEMQTLKQKWNIQ